MVGGSAKPYRLVVALETNDGVLAGSRSLRHRFSQRGNQNGLLLVNGKAVLIRGTNRHEFHQDRGQAVRPEDMLQDVLLMKRQLQCRACVALSEPPGYWYPVVRSFSVCMSLMGN